MPDVVPRARSSCNFPDPELFYILSKKHPRIQAVLSECGDICFPLLPQDSWNCPV